jgi:hypothetical protein
MSLPGEGRVKIPTRDAGRGAPSGEEKGEERFLATQTPLVMMALERRQVVEERCLPTGSEPSVASLGMTDKNQAKSAEENGEERNG